MWDVESGRKCFCTERTLALGSQGRNKMAWRRWRGICAMMADNEKGRETAA